MQDRFFRIYYSFATAPVARSRTVTLALTIDEEFRVDLGQRLHKMPK
eukprot:XP_001708760.1 Hypothetical protein GL50803_36695 [Giardia lamblia ATCC 50803]